MMVKLEGHIYKSRDIFLSKALCFLKITAEHQDCPVSNVILTVKASPQNSPHRFFSNFTNIGAGFGEKGFSEHFLEELAVPRNSASGNINNDVISLL